MEVCDTVQEAGNKTILKKKKCKKAKWLSEEALKIAVERREAKGKGEKERYNHLNADFQRTAESHAPDSHDGVIPHLGLDIRECEVKWALGSITTNKANRGDGIPVELFQILKDDAVKVLHSI